MLIDNILENFKKNVDKKKKQEEKIDFNLKDEIEIKIGEKNGNFKKY